MRLGICQMYRDLELEDIDDEEPHKRQRIDVVDVNSKKCPLCPKGAHFQPSDCLYYNWRCVMEELVTRKNQRSRGQASRQLWDDLVPQVTSEENIVQVSIRLRSHLVAEERLRPECTEELLIASFRRNMAESVLRDANLWL